MTQLTINIPDDFHEDLLVIAKQLNQSPEQCMLLALSHFFQTDTVENAIEGLARIEDGETLVDFPELKEELDLDIKFHPMAMEELEVLEEDDQVEVLGELIERISAQEESEGTLDLVLKEETAHQVVLSGFGFGDVIYSIGETVTIYHIALVEEDMADDEDEDDEEDDAEEIEIEEDETLTKA